MCLIIYFPVLLDLFAVAVQFPLLLLQMLGHGALLGFFNFCGREIGSEIIFNTHLPLYSRSDWIIVGLCRTFQRAVRPTYYSFVAKSFFLFFVILSIIRPWLAAFREISNIMIFRPSSASRMYRRICTSTYFMYPGPDWYGFRYSADLSWFSSSLK